MYGNIPWDCVIWPLKTLSYVSNWQTRDTYVQEYTELFFEGDLWWSSMAMVAEFKSDTFEGMNIHTQFTMNAIWVAKDEFDQPCLTRECRCVIWLWSPRDIVGKKVYHQLANHVSHKQSPFLHEFLMFCYLFSLSIHTDEGKRWDLIFKVCPWSVIANHPEYFPRVFRDK